MMNGFGCWTQKPENSENEVLKSRILCFFRVSMGFYLAGGFRYFLEFSPRSLGKMISNLTSIFFRWVETTKMLL